MTVLDEQRESNVSRPTLTPIGLSVRDERRMFRSAEGSAMDQGGAAGERQRYEQFSPGPEYPAATSGSGNPMQYLGSYPGHYSGQYSGQYPLQYSGQYPVQYPVYQSPAVPMTRSLGYVPSGSVSSRPPVSRNNPLFGLNLSSARPAVPLAIPHSQAVRVPYARISQPAMVSHS